MASNATSTDVAPSSAAPAPSTSAVVTQIIPTVIPSVGPVLTPAATTAPTTAPTTTSRPTSSRNSSSTTNSPQSTVVNDAPSADSGGGSSVNILGWKIGILPLVAIVIGAAFLLLYLYARVVRYRRKKKRDKLRQGLTLNVPGNGSNGTSNVNGGGAGAPEMAQTSASSTSYRYGPNAEERAVGSRKAPAAKRGNGVGGPEGGRIAGSTKFVTEPMSAELAGRRKVVDNGGSRLKGAPAVTNAASAAGRGEFGPQGYYGADVSEANNYYYGQQTEVQQPLQQAPYYPHYPTQGAMLPSHGCSEQTHPNHPYQEHAGYYVSPAYSGVPQDQFRPPLRDVQYHPQQNLDGPYSNSAPQFAGPPDGAEYSPQRGYIYPAYSQDNDGSASGEAQPMVATANGSPPADSYDPSTGAVWPRTGRVTRSMGYIPPRPESPFMISHPVDDGEIGEAVEHDASGGKGLRLVNS